MICSGRVPSRGKRTTTYIEDGFREPDVLRDVLEEWDGVACVEPFPGESTRCDVARASPRVTASKPEHVIYDISRDC